VKLIKNKEAVPPNQVLFHVSTEMTKHDVKSYLTKIYNVPVMDVRIAIWLGKIKKLPEKGYLVKDDDMKVAFVTMPKDVVFNYPDLFPASVREEDRNRLVKQEEENMEEHVKASKRN